jgi:hypothetical protein
MKPYRQYASIRVFGEVGGVGCNTVVREFCRPDELEGIVFPLREGRGKEWRRSHEYDKEGRR